MMVHNNGKCTVPLSARATKNGAAIFKYQRAYFSLSSGHWRNPELNY